MCFVFLDLCSKIVGRIWVVVWKKETCCVITCEMSNKEVDWRLKFVFSPNVILCGWLGWKQQLTYKYYMVDSVRWWTSFMCVFSSSSSSSIPLPRGSLVHHRWFHNQFPPFFPLFHCCLGLGEPQACPFPDVVFPSLRLPALSSSPFHCALQDGFGQTLRTGDMSIPLRFASL